ncbi:Hsp20 family protein [Clostridium chromiireducens]|uniref:Hsp20 family protein n=1 Tax=Clostridium chromiireducens TaxID=225345 RepID=A0A964RJB0_9CLOT|nr:Hsp20/alpha crystallin family protein [Clostridium chromiireducens]MVX62673.1 Hsp20 family protein [Clostridium chromiireducens]
MFGLIPFRTNGLDKKGGSFDDFFNGFFNDDFFSPMSFGFANNQKFNADIRETQNEYLVSAELPGVKKEDINLEYRDNTLIISATRNEVVNEEKDNYIRRERSYGQISRAFHVENVDRAQISAKFENGELHIILPKLNQTINNSSKILIQ